MPFGESYGKVCIKNLQIFIAEKNEEEISMTKLKNIFFILLVLALISQGCKDTDSEVSTGSDSASVNFRTKATYYSSSDATNVFLDSQPSDVEVQDILISEYNVVFYKVEIGNSESDKFTLWESEEGVTQNLASTELKDFESENEPVPGLYKYCRVTIGSTIHLVGAYRDTAGEADAEVNGNWTSDETDKAVFLFGTAETGTTGNFILTSEIDVQDGSSLTFVVNVADTVTYSSGIHLSPPTMTFTSE